MYDCLIADPFDNIGLKYSQFKDKMSDADYGRFLTRFINLAMDHAGIVWVSYNARHTYLIGQIVSTHLSVSAEWEAKPFVQTFTFGQNNARDCGNGHRPILRLKRKNAPLYPKAIRVESDRQKTGDKRANPDGKVPLDVWNFPRVVGNSRQKRKWHKTQLHEGLVRRMVEFSTEPGGSVLDCFSGTGTVFRVTEDRDVTGIEMDSGYCERIAAENNANLEVFSP